MLRRFSARHRAAFSISLTAALVLVSFVAPTLRPPTARAQESQAVVIPVIAPGSAYRQTNLVSDSPGLAPVLDPLLVNPWGISFRGTSPFWVANNRTSTSTLYRGDVGGSPLIKNPGLAGINIPGGLPTGTVGNTTSDFVVTSGMASGAAAFIFASITGNIVGWNGNVPAPGSTTGVIMASHPGHVFTGLANGSNITGNKLYAADFANNEIDVFDANYTLTTVPGGFVSDVPAGFAPFNIQNLGGSAPLYVAYAKVGPGGLDEEGVGNGYVRRFSTNGAMDAGFAINNGALNSPWGLAIAPASFGIFGGALLVGNFGRGNPSIHAYNPSTGAFLGTIQDESGNGIVIDELWALQFGNGGNGGDPDTLYFAAGIGHEEHGLFGKLDPTTASATNLVQFADTEFIVNEGTGHIDVTVTRLGDVSGAATVNYATFDQSQPGHASQKSDYEVAAGKLTFAAGETSKTFRVLLVGDLFDEGSEEVIDLILSNPTGAGTGLGSPNTAQLRVLDDDTGVTPGNPIDADGFFVRQHYLDFLNRVPDAAGLQFWSNQIGPPCNGNSACVQQARIRVSAAFFLSLEFQDTGLLTIMTYQAAFGRKPLYGEFMPDTQALQRDFVFGTPGAQAQLEANKQAFFDDFVTRPEFVARYGGTSNEDYVDDLLDAADLEPSQVRLFTVDMTNSQEAPPANPTSSNGGPRPVSFGTARLQFNQAQTSLTISGTVNNIDFTGAQSPAEANDNLTAAHIHANATVPPPPTRPVVFGFIGTPFNDNNPNDAVVTPFGSGVGGTFRAKWDAPEGNGTTLAAQLSNLREGRAYLNFHTTQFGGGEIRGNIPAADALRNELIAGLNAATLTRAQVLRRIAEQEELRLREFNASFVLMEYFGYLRRDPDTAGFNFWLQKLNDNNGDFIAAQLVEAFITSLEYRQRFGPN